MNTELCKTDHNNCDENTPAQVNSEKKKNYETPRYEVSKAEHAYELSVYMPGVCKSNTDITLEKNRLSIKGERNENWASNWKRHTYEICNDGFHLNLDVNVDINADKISATHIDGILKLHLPLAEEAKPKKIIIN